MEHKLFGVEAGGYNVKKLKLFRNYFAHSLFQRGLMADINLLQAT